MTVLRGAFTGWVDVPLTQVGIDEALAGGGKLADVQIDEVHTSTLIRAQMTAMLALSQHAITIAASFSFRFSIMWCYGELC